MASSGVESVSEGRALAREQNVSQRISEQTEEKLHKVFDSLDANHNGRLEVPELKVRRTLCTTDRLYSILEGLAGGKGSA